MIIPVHHLVVADIPIAAGTTIEPGMAVALDTDGYAVKCAAANYPIGLSADKNRASEAFEWVNRVSDSGIESAASGMLSVYQNGGTFMVDVNDGALLTPGGTAITGVIASGASTVPGTLLYVDGTDGLLDSGSGAGGNGTNVIAQVIESAAALDFGIPGEWEPGSSFNLTDDATPRTWVKIKLLV